MLFKICPPFRMYYVGINVTLGTTQILYAINKNLFTSKYIYKGI
jgi:hypothetical protein